MALFPMSCVLRGFSPSTHWSYAPGKNPCAALPIEKIAHFQIENEPEAFDNSVKDSIDFSSRI
jgi:hypothetical protein